MEKWRDGEQRESPEIFPLRDWGQQQNTNGLFYQEPKGSKTASPTSSHPFYLHLPTLSVNENWGLIIADLK